MSQTSKMHTKPFRLVQDVLQNNAYSLPEKVALICEKERFSYEQLDAMANRMANALISQGVQRGDRIILYMYNCVELVVSVFATLKAGGIFSVVDYSTRPDKLAYIATDCGAVVLVTHDHQVDLTVKLMKDVSCLRLAILTGSWAADKVEHNSRLLSFEQIQLDYPTDLPGQKTIDCDLAYLLYTSGSTGDPKGVMTTHRSSLFAIEIAIEYLGLSENDIVTSPMPLSYSHGFNQLLKTLRVGATLILEKSFAFPAQTLKRMEKEKATRFAGVPTMYAILLKMDLSRYDLSQLKHLSSAGAPLAPALIDQLRKKLTQAIIYSIYGMAEASNALALDPDQINQHPASVGKAFPGTEVWLVDEDGNRLGVNQIGELVVRGGHVRCGYWNDPETSAVRFRADLLPGELVCYSGDMFQIDDEGYLFFMGRKDEIIKSGGKKIAPKEIENIIYKLVGVLDAAVVAVPDPMLGQVPKAYVVVDSSQEIPLTTKDILDHCRISLENYMVPRHIEIRTSLPKTPSGKIIKTALLEERKN
jgi:amino acid adenylation domain-containing protein